MIISSQRGPEPVVEQSEIFLLCKVLNMSQGYRFLQFPTKSDEMLCHMYKQNHTLLTFKKSKITNINRHKTIVRFFLSLGYGPGAMLPTSGQWVRPNIHPEVSTAISWESCVMDPAATLSITLLQAPSGKKARESQEPVQ